MSFLQILLAVLFPPLSVFMSRGVGGSLLLNIVLTIIGWIPGVIHALIVASGSPRAATV